MHHGRCSPTPMSVPKVVAPEGAGPLCGFRAQLSCEGWEAFGVIAFTVLHSVENQSRYFYFGASVGTELPAISNPVARIAMCMLWGGEIVQASVNAISFWGHYKRVPRPISLTVSVFGHVV